MPRVLDTIDRQILHDLQENGRITNVDLAARVGLTAPPCLRRVRMLEDDGLIRGYHAAVDAGRLGFAITVFALVSLKSQAERDLRAFEAHVPNSTRCASVTCSTATSISSSRSSRATLPSSRLS